MIFKYPKTACVIAGALCAFAMAPFYAYPLMMIGISLALAVLIKQDKASTGGWCMFAFGMGFFTLGLWWIANALLIDVKTYWWAVGFSVLGLPAVLSAFWFVPGYLATRFSKSNTLGRAVLALILLGVMEYGRAFIFTGFPWNLFGYMWAGAPAIAQTAALGGVYLLTLLTLFWMAAPVLLWQARQHTKIFYATAFLIIASFAGAFAYGTTRLQNEVATHKDIAVAIIQPNLKPDEKWEAKKAIANVMTHIAMTKSAIESIKPTDDLKTVAIVWPETALDEGMLNALPDVAGMVANSLKSKDFSVELVTGLGRQTPADANNKAGYYNSLAMLSNADGVLRADAVYDKHHLVPFGEYIPFEEIVKLTPVVGFDGFKRGPGPRTLHANGLPGATPMICFEAIFPWYAKSDDAQWLINTSNDGWYGNTPGPYQHLAMTQFRAIEQGKPVVRAATTGVSAVIDPYGRIIESLGYEKRGTIVSALPQKLSENTLYSRTGELAFFMLLGGVFVGFLILRVKEI